MTTLPKCFIGSYVKNGDSIKPEKVLESDDCKILRKVKCKMRKVEVIPVVIRALRTVTKHFEKWIEKL